MECGVKNAVHRFQAADCGFRRNDGKLNRNDKILNVKSFVELFQKFAGVWGQSPQGLNLSMKAWS